MENRDRVQTCLSLFLFGAAFVLPLVALSIGWLGWDFRTGAIAGLITFAIMFIISGGLLAMVKMPSWLAVFLPMLLGLIYTILPDFIPMPFDDAAIFTSGALLSFVLWLRKQPDTPRWIILPMLVSSLYALVGGMLPGPIDEMFIGIIGLGAAYYYGYLLPNKDKGITPTNPFAPQSTPPAEPIITPPPNVPSTENQAPGDKAP